MPAGGDVEIDTWLTAHPGARLVVIDVFAKVRGSATRRRRRLSEALTAMTPALLDGGAANRPDGVLLRRALHRWAFNTARRESAERPAEIRDALCWVRARSLPVEKLAEPAVLRRVLDVIAGRLDGRPAAGSVVSKRLRMLFNVAEFALMYFAGLRPEEAANVRKQDLSLPAKGWGGLYLEEATPHAGSDWTNDGRQRDQRQLKNRARGEGRVVPSPPELTAHLQDHLAEFGTDAEGRLFRGERAAELPKLTYMRTWRAARRRAFTPEAAASCWP
jgi:integrase